MFMLFDEKSSTTNVVTRLWKTELRSFSLRMESGAPERQKRKASW